MQTQRINERLRLRRLTVGITEGQVAEEVARLVAVQTGRELAIDANYVSKLERGVITWPNRAYREAFRTFFDAANDAELGFYPSRTRRDAESWRRATVQGGSVLPTGFNTKPALGERIGHDDSYRTSFGVHLNLNSDAP